MIKLVVSDVDGTLLPKNKSCISSEMLELIHQLAKRKVLFAAASGRAYHDLKRLFEPVADQMIFICLDGALVLYQDEVLWGRPIEKNEVQSMIDQVWDRTKYQVLLYGTYLSYLKARTKEFESQIWAASHHHVKMFETVDEIPEPVYKVAFYDKYCKEKSRFLSQAGSAYTNIYSDNGWHEYTLAGVNKGDAVSCLQKCCNIQPEETMAFGDNLNDIEMLQKAKYKFAMINGKFKVQSICQQTIVSVEDTLKKMMKEMGR